MEKTYDHNLFEEPVYKKWEDSGGFNPDSVHSPTAKKDVETFCIIMPPPNANDPLHVGHALFVAIEDILTRYNRMRGKASLWLPGTDHAGIETQYVFEKKLAKKDQSRFDFDRETLYKMIWDYVQESSGVAVNQMKRLGASADWSRFRFTLDKEIVDQVLETFNKLHQDGLVYRGERLVNYCSKCGTSYSDLEVDYVEKTEGLYYVKYDITGSEDVVVIATTRPETIPADVNAAVNPDDERYTHLVGAELINPLSKKTMKVVVDRFVDKEFGTGVVKLTPAHDKADWEVAERLGLERINLIEVNGRLNQVGGELAGLKVAEARKKAEALLIEMGRLDPRTKNDYSHRVGVCYRCQSTIELLPLPQFFIKVEPLTQMAVAALDSGETTILGTGRDKILRDWLNNLKDWNISRQVVWGIRMPIWYDVTARPEIRVSCVVDGEKISGEVGELRKKLSLEQIRSGLQELQAPKDAPYQVSREIPGENYIQETNTFDTWFSSGQWPIVTLKAASHKSQDTSDFERFYPTTVMETGYDILPFWVMRMMLLCIYLDGKSPFKTVYLHGLVRDEKGQKMSKSKGNVINPIDMVEKYGADAIRMALVMSSTPGQDKSVGESTIKGMRNFSNKIWNAARYVIAAMADDQAPGSKQIPNSNDQVFQEKMQRVIEEMTNLLEEYRIGLAAEVAYNEFWHWFCDEAIEAAKKGEISLQTLRMGLETWLRLLHPFVPFVTETVWGEIENTKNQNPNSKFISPSSYKMLMNESWPLG